MRRFEKPLEVLRRFLIKKADLNPPLGFPGGICHVVERVEDKIRNPRLEDSIVNMVEQGRLPNAAASKIYPRITVKGAWKFPFILSSHVQYRMDLREVTLPEIRSSIDKYFRKVNSLRSKGDTNEWDKFLSGKEIVLEDPRLKNLVVVFKKSKDKVVIISSYRRGEIDPKGPCFKVD